MKMAVFNDDCQCQTSVSQFSVAWVGQATVVHACKVQILLA